MKRVGYLYEKVIDYDNIVAAMADYDTHTVPATVAGESIIVSHGK